MIEETSYVYLLEKWKNLIGISFLAGLIFYMVLLSTNFQPIMIPLHFQSIRNSLCNHAPYYCPLTSLLYSSQCLIFHISYFHPPIRNLQPTNTFSSLSQVSTFFASIKILLSPFPMFSFSFSLFCLGGREFTWIARPSLAKQWETEQKQEKIKF